MPRYSGGSMCGHFRIMDGNLCCHLLSFL